MKYDVTYSCGHVGRIDLIGKQKDRDWKLKYTQEQPCSECRAKKLLEQGKEAQRVNVEEEGMRPLTGSEKQVNWAEQIRRDFCIMADTAFHEVADPEIKNLILLTKSQFMEHGNASYWIDERDMLKSHFCSALDKNYEKRNELAVAEVVAAERAEIETFRPTGNAVSESVVTLTNVDGIVKIKSGHKIEELRLVMRARNFSFKTECWQKRISVTDGNADNYIAFIANELLAVGLVIRIECDSAAELLKAKLFSTPPTKMVVRQESQFGFWFDRDAGDYYHAIRNLPNAKWKDGKGWVNSEHFESVIDFAAEHGFAFSAGALELLAKVKAERQKQTEITPEHFAVSPKMLVSGKPAAIPVPEVSVCEELLDKE